ncbi:MAG: HAMP domain-containing sensor histidine kinase, partial [Mucinivorans sp.]
TEVFTTTAELKGIHIKFDEQSSGRVWADSDMVKTVMRNLLSNAIKFSNTGGTINITIESQDQDFVTINVKDCGRGIKEEDKAKLLVVDTHFSTFGTSNEEGSGLGLLLCVDFVNKHGGRLWFESKEGEGSTFSFTLPKSKE